MRRMAACFLMIVLAPGCRRDHAPPTTARAAPAPIEPGRELIVTRPEGGDLWGGEDGPAFLPIDPGIKLRAIAAPDERGRIFVRVVEGPEAGAVGYIRGNQVAPVPDR
jgi:hypothetical protein